MWVVRGTLRPPKFNCISCENYLSRYRTRYTTGLSRRLVTTSCICGFRTCLDICPAQSAASWKPIDDHKDLAPYLGSSSDNIVSMLQFGRLVVGERFLDIGAGDGRVLLEAIRQGAAAATGYELSEDVYQLGLRHIKMEFGYDQNIMSRCRLLHQDALQTDFHELIRSYDLITMFLLPRGLEKVAKCLRGAMSQASRDKSSNDTVYARLVTQGWPLPLTKTDSCAVQILLHDTITLSGGSTLYLYHIKRVV